MKVLDVGCGVGGPAREMVKFSGCHVTGLNINEYQVSRARAYALKEGLADKLDFVQGAFLVRPLPPCAADPTCIFCSVSPANAFADGWFRKCRLQITRLTPCTC
jgi:sterol 24-C-methyltransferase